MHNHSCERSHLSHSLYLTDLRHYYKVLDLVHYEFHQTRVRLTGMVLLMNSYWKAWGRRARQMFHTVIGPLTRVCLCMSCIVAIECRKSFNGKNSAVQALEFQFLSSFKKATHVYITHTKSVVTKKYVLCHVCVTFGLSQIYITPTFKLLTEGADSKVTFTTNSWSRADSAFGTMRIYRFFSLNAIYRASLVLLLACAKIVGKPLIRAILRDECKWDCLCQVLWFPRVLVTFLPLLLYICLPSLTSGLIYSSLRLSCNVLPHLTDFSFNIWQIKLLCQ